MGNEDLLAYLREFEKFNISKIQRKFKWGYIRAIENIINLVDLNLIAELPNEIMTFRVLNENEISLSSNKESFRKILEDREPPKLIDIKKTVRLWFEPIDTDDKLKPIEATSRTINRLITENASKKIIVSNASNLIRIRFGTALRKNSNLKFGGLYTGDTTPSVMAVIIKSHEELKLIRKAIQASIEKIYIIGNKNLLDKYLKILNT